MTLREAEFHCSPLDAVRFDPFKTCLKLCLGE